MEQYSKNGIMSSEQRQNIIQTAYKIWKSLIELDKHIEAYGIAEEYLIACGLTMKDFHNYILEKNGFVGGCIKL